MCGVLRKIMAYALVALTQNVNFVQIGFTSQSDFIVGIQQSAMVYEVISLVSMVTPRSVIYVSAPNLFFAAVRFVNNLTSLTSLISVGALKKVLFSVPAW
jgi:hypothetical protein